MANHTIILARIPITGIIVLAIAAAAVALFGWFVGLLVGVVFNASSKLDAASAGAGGSITGTFAFLIASLIFNFQIYPGVNFDVGAADFRIPLDLIIFAGGGAALAAILDR